MAAVSKATAGESVPPGQPDARRNAMAAQMLGQLFVA